MTKFESSPIETVFFILSLIFIFIVGMIFLPIPEEIKRSLSTVYILSWVLFFVLGLVLLFMIVKQTEKVTGWLRFFLILTSASAVGFTTGVILHNFSYALAEVVRYSDTLTRFFHSADAAFFIFAIIICPIGYFLGTIGTIALALPKKKPLTKF